MVQLVQVMLSRKNRSVADHLCKDTTHRPYVNRLRVAFGIKHDFWRTIPPSGDIFGEKSSVVVLGICHTGQTKITYLDKNTFKTV